MVKKKKLSGNFENLKFLKKYTKQRLKKKYIFFFNFRFKINLLLKFQQNPKKNRKWLYYRLSKYRLIYNYRQLSFLEEFGNKFIYKINLFDSLYNVQRRYSYYVFVSQNYYNLTDYHLELFRRFLRKKLGKKVFIFCTIKPYLSVLKRPNQVRMGGGKGSKFSKLIYPLYPGCIFIEIRGGLFKYVKLIVNKLLKKMSFSFKLVNFQRL